LWNQNEFPLFKNPFKHRESANESGILSRYKFDKDYLKYNYIKV